jgi:hypothetical protein
MFCQIIQNAAASRKPRLPPFYLVSCGPLKLTNFGERIILNLMKTEVLVGIILVLLTPPGILSQAQESHPPPKTKPPAETVPAPPQEFPAKKPRYDYWGSFFSRNTRPLGLKENLALKKLLRQKGVTWAVRTEIRHILD